MKPLTLAAAGLAATSHAFVIVPEISTADSDIVNALPFEASFTADRQSVKLDCPGCPMRWLSEDAAIATTTTAIPNHLELDFVVSHEPDVDRLLLNGFELYPNVDPWSGTLRAPQVMNIVEVAMKHGYKAHPPTTPLGYTVAIRPVAKEETDQQLELLEVELQIIEVGDNFVHGIPTVRVKLLKTPEAKLMIANVETTDAIPAAKGSDKSGCTTMTCKWRAMVKAHLKGIKGFKHCGKHMGHGHHKSMPKLSADGSQVYYEHQHTWKQLFKNITSYILLPVLIGIVAGVSLSILGMMVGTLAVCIWRVVVRRQTPWASGRQCRRRRGHSCHKSNHTETAVVEEKTGLIDHQDAPPEYQDVQENEAVEDIDSKV